MSMLFSSDEMGAMSGGVSVPAPKNYRLPDRFPSLKNAYRIALDIEAYDPEISTKGPGWRRSAYLVGTSLAIQERDGSISFAEYYPTGHKKGPNLDANLFIEYLENELTFFTGEIVGANLLYDADGLQSRGVVAPCAKWRDVQWAEALLDEYAISYRLNVLAKKWLNETKVTEELKALYGDDYITRFQDVHPGHARAYGLGDVRLPLRILDAQYKGNEQFDGLNKQHLTELFHLESRLLPFLLYMRQQGVRVDLDAAAKLGDMLLAKRDNALREASRRAGMEINAENFGKPTVLAAALDKLRIAYPMTTGSKNEDESWKSKPRPSITDKFLNDLDDPIGELLATANQCDKAHGTFVTGYVQDYAINGRVHCEFHPLRKISEQGKKNGTITGRFSGTHPNLQNIPARDEEIGPLCRAMFVADHGAEWWSQDYCVTPETRILTANLEWKRADTLSIGEELVSCDEVPRVNKTQGHRWLRRGRVEHATRLLQPCVRIVTDQGEVTCSTEHRWLARKGNQTYSWRRAKKLKPGQTIAFLCKPWEEDISKDGGWLSGILDGEGTLGYGSISFGQKATGNNLLVLEKGIRLLRDRQYNLHVSSDEKTHVSEVRINGGREELLRLLGTLRPVRLLAKASEVWENRMLRNKCTPAAKILSVIPLGLQAVIALQTDQKTFIAEGFVSHNSQIEYRMLVHYSVALKCKGAEVPQQMYKKNPDTDFHEMCAALVWALEWNENIRAYKAGEKTEEKYEKEKKRLRKPAKNLNFGLVYGMGVDKLARELGLIDTEGKPTQEAKDLIAKYHAGAPFIKDLNSKCGEEGQRLGYITTILGRRGRFNLWEPKEWKPGTPKEKPLPKEEAEAKWGKGKIKRSDTHKGLNKRLQGSAADLMKLAMVLLWESGVFDPGNDITCTLTVHDELNGSVAPSARGKTALLEVKHIMENCMQLNVPILTSGSTGSNWSEAK